MKYRTVFDIIGPVMIGPSSSHTAGAARIGKVARALLLKSLNGQMYISTALLRKRTVGTERMSLL